MPYASSQGMRAILFTLALAFTSNLAIAQEKWEYLQFKDWWYEKDNSILTFIEFPKQQLITGWTRSQDKDTMSPKELLIRVDNNLKNKGLNLNLVERKGYVSNGSILDELGKSGWELVTKDTIYHHEGKYIKSTYYFKRKLK